MSQVRTLGLWPRSLLASAWRRALATGWRLRTSVAVAVALTLFFGWVGTSAASAADDARREMDILINQTGTVSVSNLLEPGTYVLLADQSRAVEDSLVVVADRLAFLRPFEFIPFVGSSVRDARNTALIGENVARASGVVWLTYGRVLESQLSVGDPGALADTIVALENAERRLLSGTMLSPEEMELVGLAIVTLKTLATVAVDAPAGMVQGFAVLASVSQLQELVDDPLIVLVDPQQPVTLIASMRRDVTALIDTLSAAGSADQSMDLALDGLRVASAGAEAIGHLLGVAEALELGLFSEGFGVAAAGDLRAAQLSVTEAKELLGELRVGILERSGIGSQIGGDELDGAFAAAERALAETDRAIDAMWTSLGYDEPATYLFVLQNQDEIRATGGFIGAVLEIPLVNGILGEIVYEDSVRIDGSVLVDNPLAPEPIYWYLWISRWLFRDANWNPDFPTSARTLIDFYERTRSTRASGALTGSKLLSTELVGALGGVRVPGSDLLIDAQLAYEFSDGQLLYECDPTKHVSMRGDRCFDEDLIQSLLDRLAGPLDDDEREGMVGVLVSHLEKKNILLFAKDEGTQEFLTERGWTGAIGEHGQDMLMVIDSSLPGHNSSAIGRSVDYRVELSLEDASRADLRIRYENSVVPDSPVCRQAVPHLGGCFWNYVRVLLPRVADNVVSGPLPLHDGSEKLIWGHRDLETVSVIGHAGGGLTGLVEIGAYLVVDPSSTLIFPVSYDLGPSVVRSFGGGRFEYRLKLIKQPGIDGDQVDVEVVLPEGTRMTTRSAGMVATADGAIWTGVLGTDVELVVGFEAR